MRRALQRWSLVVAVMSAVMLALLAVACHKSPQAVAWERSLDAGADTTRPRMATVLGPPIAVGPTGQLLAQGPAGPIGPQGLQGAMGPMGPPGVGTAGQTTNTLANGLNSNIPTSGLPTLRFAGPSAAFSVGGFAQTAPPAGFLLVVVNTTTQPMTIVNEDASSTSSYRITTGSGANVTLVPSPRSVSFLYDGTTSRWRLQSSGLVYQTRVTPYDFGAVGNGVADDTAAFNSMFAACLLTPGLIAHSPAATYIVTGVAVPAGVVWEGAGQGATVINFANSSINNGAGVQLGAGARMAHMTVQGAAKYAVSVVGANATIDDVEVTGGNVGGVGDDIVAGIAIGASGSGGVDNVTIQNSYIHGNGIVGDAGGPTGQTAEVYGYYGTNPITRLKFLHNNVVSGTTPFAVALFSLQDSLIDGNDINENNSLGTPAASGYGLVIYDSGQHLARNKVTNNTIHNTAGTGIYYESGPYTPGPQDSASPTPNVVISGNVLSSVALQQLDSSLLVAGISCNAVNSVIANNQITVVGPDSAGISTQGNGSSVHGNIITGVPSRPAIYIASAVVSNGITDAGFITDYHTAQHTSVYGNTITDCLAGGIYTNVATLDGLSISGNTIGWTYTSFAGNASANTLTTISSNFANGQTVRVRSGGGTLPSGLSAYSVYYIINLTTSATFAQTFQLAGWAPGADGGSTPIALTTAGSGTIEVALSPLSGGYGLYFPGDLTGSTVSGNVVEGMQQGCMILSANAGATSSNIISGNSFQNCSYKASGSYYGLYNSGANNTIIGNYIGGGGTISLVDVGTATTIVGNNFTNSAAGLSWAASAIVGVNQLGGASMSISSGGQLLSFSAGAGGLQLQDSGVLNIGAASGQDNFNITSKTQLTVGGAGDASALALVPAGYLLETINGTEYAVPYYLSH